MRHIFVNCSVPSSTVPTENCQNGNGGAKPLSVDTQALEAVPTFSVPTRSQMPWERYLPRHSHFPGVYIYTYIIYMYVYIIHTYQYCIFLSLQSFSEEIKLIKKAALVDAVMSKDGNCRDEGERCSTIIPTDLCSNGFSGQYRARVFCHTPIASVRKCDIQRVRQSTRSHFIPTSFSTLTLTSKEY